ncbi:MAG: D-alanine--D-alanine ligase [Oscillatoriales cyanobacterium SM2_1_8]|nr:D-alanine--D-alanine ligase [Oscillatoriales cyanobacterium SM2_1_8]
MLPIPQRVLQVVGSPTHAFWADLSRLYAADCARALGDRVDFRYAWIEPGGWRLPVSLAPADIAAAPLQAPAGAIAQIAQWGMEGVLPQLFCEAGMTDYRALWSVLGLPYLGNASATMAIAARKDWARALVQAAGVAIPPGQVLTQPQTPHIVPPAVVKPATADNSTGVEFVADWAGYDRAIAQAFAHSPAVLVEAYIPLGREVRCGLMADGETLQVLPLEEYQVDNATHPIRRPEDKLRRDDTGQLHLAAKDGIKAWMVDRDDPLTAIVGEAARKCHHALGCRSYSLFDFRVDPAGQPYFLEAGLYCSFSPQSVLVTMAAAAGIDLLQADHV